MDALGEVLDEAFLRVNKPSVARQSKTERVDILYHRLLFRDSFHKRVQCVEVQHRSAAAGTQVHGCVL